MIKRWEIIAKKNFVMDDVKVEAIGVPSSVRTYEYQDLPKNLLKRSSFKTGKVALEIFRECKAKGLFILAKEEKIVKALENAKRIDTLETVVINEEVEVEEKEVVINEEVEVEEKEVAIDEEVEVEEKEVAIDEEDAEIKLSDLTVSELKEMCKERKLTNYSSLKKEELIKLLND